MKKTKEINGIIDMVNMAVTIKNMMGIYEERPFPSHIKEHYKNIDTIATALITDLQKEQMRLLKTDKEYLNYCK